MKKRVLCYLLCFVMCICVFPIGVYAASESGEVRIEERDNEAQQVKGEEPIQPEEPIILSDQENIGVLPGEGFSEYETSGLVDDLFANHILLSKNLLSQNEVTLKDLIADAENDSVIVLTKNYEYFSSSEEDEILINKGVAIDFNGYKITVTGDDDLFNIDEAGSLTLINAEIDAASDVINTNDGTVIVRSTSGTGIHTGYDFIDMNNGALIIEDGLFNCDECVVDESSELSSITVQSGNFATGSYCFDDISGTAEFYNVTVNSESSCIYVCDNATVNIYGGSYTTPDDCVYNNGTVTIYAGSFTATDDSDGCLYGSGDYIIPDSSIAEPEYWRDIQASQVTVRPRIITVTFMSEGKQYSTLTGNPADFSFPDDPIHSSGFDFLFWEDDEENRINDLSLLKADTTLNAVFTDRQYTVTFDDNGNITTEKVYIFTALGEVPGLDRTDDGDNFCCWMMGDRKVNTSTDFPVQKDIKLVAKYINHRSIVSNYRELIDAVEEKADYIELAADIPIEDTVCVDYDCTITSANGSRFGLIRPDNFLAVLFSTEKGVTGGGEAGGVNPTGTTITFDNVLVDGRNIEADDPAIYVKSGTKLILENTTIQNNKNAGWDGGGVFNLGTLKMFDGTMIKNNQAQKGGGVYNAEPYYGENEPVVFYMYGGEISGNTALDDSTSCNAAGGGVNVDGSYSRQSKFYMYGGSITGNSAPNGCGGGVSLCCGDQSVVATDGKEKNIIFYMYDGEITNNTTGESGGGVWIACSSMYMENGIIARNMAAEDGGGLSACCGCEKNIDMRGGTITLNLAQRGGGVGEHVGGFLLSEAIYDNLTTGEDSEAYGWPVNSYGDDVGFYNADEWIKIAAPKAYRSYGSSYSSVPVSSTIQAAINSALPTVSAELIDGYEAPSGVMIPFAGWYVDGHQKDDVARYTSPYGPIHSSDSMEWHRGTYDDPLDEGKGAKAIWYGLLLVYDANYEGGGHEYDAKAYLPGSDMDVAANMFTREGYTFSGWNTKPDGSGTSYQPNGELNMSTSRVLYAQWEENLYKLNYEVTGDPVYGSPADASAPAQKTDIIYNTMVTLEADPVTEWNTSTGKDDTGVPGIWSFTGWSTDTRYADNLTEKVILKDETVYGKWVFTPNTYTVIYVVNGDATYGTPADGIAPTDENNPYDYKEQVSVKADLTTAWTTSDGTANGVPGTWVFMPWDRKDFQITEDTIITGAWKFTKNSSGPETRDNSNMPLWISLMGISALSMIGTLFIKTKKSSKNAQLKNK